MGDLPALTIRFIKRGSKLPLLQCVRENGSETIAEIVVGPEHDLAHFAIETMLGFKSAFYGMVATGFDIQDFNIQSATRRIDFPATSTISVFYAVPTRRCPGSMSATRAKWRFSTRRPKSRTRSAAATQSVPKAAITRATADAAGRDAIFPILPRIPGNI